MIIHEFHNAEDNMTGIVAKNTSKPGHYNAVLRDDDSGEVVPLVYILDSEAKAIAKAKSMANI